MPWPAHRDRRLLQSAQSPAGSLEVLKGAERVSSGLVPELREESYPRSIESDVSVSEVKNLSTLRDGGKGGRRCGVFAQQLNTGMCASVVVSNPLFHTPKKATSTYCVVSIFCQV